MRAARGRKGYILTTWGLRASSQGMPMSEVLATIRKMRRKTVAQLLEWVRGGGR